MNPVIWIALAVFAALVVLGIVLKYLVRWMSFPCQFCGKKVKAFEQIDLQEQQNILAYFQEHERREPDKAGLFICTHCNTVHDDFSGEKLSREPDAFSCTFCKVCGRMLYQCEPDRGVITCRDCKTQYQWQTHEKSGFRFFTPPRGVQLLDRCPFGIDR